MIRRIQIFYPLLNQIGIGQQAAGYFGEQRIIPFRRPRGKICSYYTELHEEGAENHREKCNLSFRREEESTNECIYYAPSWADPFPLNVTRNEEKWTLRDMGNIIIPHHPARYAHSDIEGKQEQTSNKHPTTSNIIFIHQTI